MIKNLSYIAQVIKQNTDVNLPTVAADSSTVETVLRLVWIVSTILSVIFVAIGGLKYTLSNGDSNQINSAKNTILYALVGLVISLLAFVITTFVLGRLA